MYIRSESYIFCILEFVVLTSSKSSISLSSVDDVTSSKSMTVYRNSLLIYDYQSTPIINWFEFVSFKSYFHSPLHFLNQGCYPECPPLCVDLVVVNLLLKRQHVDSSIHTLCNHKHEIKFI